MKRFLPKTRFTPQGFTLIELMIVISIIAILSVIGMVIYGGVQKSARDARRKADIDSIANAMEANYDKPTNPGQYSPLAATMFSSGVIPEDPIGAGSATGCGGAICIYCVTQHLTTIPVRASCISTSSLPAEGVPLGGTAKWTICANLEGTTNTFYCRSNQQ